MRFVVLLVACLVLALAGARPARADMLEGWIATVNLRVRDKPPFEGSTDHSLVPIGSFALRKTAGPIRFEPADHGGGLALFGSDNLQIGPVLDIGGHRGDDPRYPGLARIPMAVEPGVFVEVWPTNWLRGFVQVDRSVTQYAATLVDVAADYVYTGDRVSASIGPRAAFGDGRYMQMFFGVTPQEAARSPLFHTAYSPAGGLRYAGVAAAVGYRINDHLRTTLDMTVTRLGSAGADSPLVRLSGTTTQVSAGLGFSYTLGRLR